MKFKLDENLPMDLAHLLAARGYQVDTVFSKGLQGASDRIIFEKVVSENCLLITSDLDFSDIRNYPIGLHSGIILIRLSSESKDRILKHFQWILDNFDLGQFAHALVIKSDHKIRIKR